MKPFLPSLPARPVGHRRTTLLIRLRLLVVAVLLPAAAGPPAAASSGPEAHQAHFDALFTSMMQERDIPGLAVVLVQGNEVVLRSGYGWADRDRRIPVDPERTIFPLGSISKVLTTIGVLQLVESGVLELDANISRYLESGQVDRRFPDPVTLRHLLTHTDGFDVRWLFGGAARVPEQVRPLAASLTQLPARVLPPGQIYFYGDVGMTLAGYILERVSRQPFADYMEQRLFQPLGMTGATFRPSLSLYARNRATGYDYDRFGQLQAQSVVYPHATPASGVVAPVADLAPLLIALLNDGRYESHQLLGADSVRAMVRVQFAHASGIPGTSFGCYEYFYQGRRVLVHGGLLPGFTTVIAFIPDAKVGICVAANRFDLIEPFETDLLRQLLERFPSTPAGPAAPAAPIARTSPQGASLHRLAGTYRCDQYSRASADKLFVLAGLAAEIRVEAKPDGTLQFDPGGGPWREIEPRLFAHDTTGERVMFRTDARGRGTRILGSAQFMSYHRVGPADNIPLHAAIAAGIVLLAGTGGLYGAFAGMRMRRNEPAPASLRWLRALAIAAPVTLIAFLAGLWAVMNGLTFAAAAFGQPPLLPLIRLVPLAVGFAALLQLIIATTALCSRSLRRREPLAYGLTALATLLLLPLLAHWQLVRLPWAPLI